MQEEILLIYLNTEIENPYKDIWLDDYYNKDTIIDTEAHLWVPKAEALRRVESQLLGKASRAEIEEMIEIFINNYDDKLEENFIIKTLYKCFEPELKEKILIWMKEDVEEQLEEEKERQIEIELLLEELSKTYKKENIPTIKKEEVESYNKRSFSGFTF